MRQPAAYCRYSTDSQEASSIEDQARQCKALAQRGGETIDESRIYSDEALSGKGGAVTRPGYKQLLDAWDAGLISILYLDELCRLTRDEADGAQLMKKVAKTGVMVITGDGIDTRQRGWEMQWMMRLTMAGEEVRTVSARTSRTMEGCLERGWMIAAPPFGYNVDWSLGRPGDGHEGGARWVVEPVNAELVREMYERRAKGNSVHKIALWLNESGISSPRLGRDKLPSYWRGATISRMLANPIYKGCFVYQGSAFTRSKLKYRSEKPKLTRYPREAYRLVSDELWDRCNPSAGERKVRGGRKHSLSGLIVCGFCNSTLSVKVTRTSETLHCPGCEQAVKVGARGSWIGYTSVPAALLALKSALLALLAGPAVDEFRKRLAARLKEGPGNEEARVRSQIAQLTSARQRLAKLARNESIGLEALQEEMTAVEQELQAAKFRLHDLERLRAPLSPQAVAKQVAVRLEPLLERLLHGEPAPHEVRAMLGRLVSRFAFVERPAKNAAVFELAFVPGAYVAEQVEGATLDREEVLFRYRVSTTARRPTVWVVDRL